MSGPAMKLFKKQNLRTTKTVISKWQKLNFLMENGHLAYIDIAIAEEMLKDPTEENECAAALICHLSAASRQGHLCLEVTEDHIFPTITGLWECNKDESLFDEDDLKGNAPDCCKDIEDLIRIGTEKLPQDIFFEVQLSETNPKALQTFICKMGTRFYFQRHWYFETLFLQHYQRLSKTSPAIEFNPLIVQTKVAELQSQNKLLKEQADAIINSSRQALMMISGGPGTGKTYTAGLLVDILLEAIPNDKKNSFEIALAAPTGKAAANLQKSLLRALQGLQSASKLQAKTLHALLGLRGSESPEHPHIPLSADLVIVDESSMIDARLMAYLFAFIKPGARLILLGDPLQLPAVESGSLFADLISLAKLAGNSSITELQVCLRAELQGIVNFASCVKNGDVNGCETMLNELKSDSGVRRLNFELNASKEICLHALPFYRTQSISKTEPEALLKHFDRFRILSPFRKGPYGVESINSKILKELHKAHLHHTPFITPIILLRNDPRLDLFNGETGVLVRKCSASESIFDGDFSQGDYALFPGRSENEGVRAIPALLLPAFEYAYCLSVHKSQGSEYEHVLLLLPEGSEGFGREVLYTAVTRARKKLELWDQPGILKKTIARQSCRFSGLIGRIV